MFKGIFRRIKNRLYMFVHRKKNDKTKEQEKEKQTDKDQSQSAQFWILACQDQMETEDLDKTG